jgi:enterochelin esterase-like enzyme/L-ascorbate metabolism protein UlaG (beta-lactamase superfamily)
MKYRNIFCIAIISVLVLSLVATAQDAPSATGRAGGMGAAPGGAAAGRGAGRGQASPGASIVSPEVLSDRRVTFRIYAPQATRVTVTGEWGQGASDLTKDEQGIWSVTLGPFESNVHRYSFSVDGVQMLDPRNMATSESNSNIRSLVDIPGPDADFMAIKPVPHGALAEVWYQSPSWGTRRMHIYTPPGYGASTDKYPVLYLIHGGGDNDDSWSTVGRAGFIMDNLLADKKAKPMIIVMPTWNPPQSTSGRGAAPGGANSGGLDQFGGVFSKDLLEALIPWVESNYRVLPDRESRAIAGLSMGGTHTVYNGFGHPEKFAWVGVFSSGGGAERDDFKTQFASFLSKPDETNKMMKLIWIKVGDNDSMAGASTRQLQATLKDAGIKTTYGESGGAHTWINWRHYLNEFAPLLFQTTAGTSSVVSGSGFEEDTFETNVGKLKITLVGHGTLMFDFAGKIIHVDPVSMVTDYSKMPKADLVLITHDHPDHLDPASVELIRKPDTRIFLPQTCASKITDSIVMKNGETQAVGGLKIEAVPAYNLVQAFHPKGVGNGYIITFGDKRVYVAGDTENIPEMKEIKNIDIAFLPMNLPYTMTPEMGAEAARVIKPKILYPYHYKGTQIQQVVDLLKDSEEIVVRIRKME